MPEEVSDPPEAIGVIGGALTAAIAILAVSGSQFLCVFQASLGDLLCCRRRPRIEPQGPAPAARAVVVARAPRRRRDRSRDRFPRRHRDGNA